MSEKKLTPMQELIEKLVDYRRIVIDAGAGKAQPSTSEQIQIDTLTVAIATAKSLLEKERDAIENAYNQGYRDGEIETPDQYTRDISEFNDANQYFNETFKTEE